MTKQQLVNGLTYLGTAFNKTYTQTECELHYDFLGGYNFDTFVKAIKSIIRKSKFAPKVSELIDECEEAKFADRLISLEKARQFHLLDNYNYEKIYDLVAAGYIPPFCKDEIDKGYKLIEQTALTPPTKELKEG